MPLDEKSTNVEARRIPEMGRALLQALGQTAKALSLYRQGHPVPEAALKQCRDLFDSAFARTGWDRITLGVAEGRWIFNGAVLGDAAQLGEVIVGAFQGGQLQSVSFLRGIQAYELGAFCELSALPAARLEEIDPNGFLKQKGVQRVVIEGSSFSRAPARAPASMSPIESPIPARKAKAPQQSEPPNPKKSANFSALLKGLVEEAVSDPQEQARIYANTVETIKQALQQRVAQQTRNLKAQAERVLSERVRTEKVIATLAEGKIVVDRNGRVLMMDPTAEKILGRRLVDVAGKHILDGFKSDEQMVSLSQDIAAGSAGDETKVDIAGTEMVTEAFRSSMALLHNEEGRVVGTYGVLPSASKFRETQKLQEEFVSQVTHELKAPLASICSALEIVEQMSAGKLGPQERHFLDITRRNSAKLKGMIDEILDFSKLESGRMEARVVPSKVGPMLQEAVEGLRPWASSKRINLEADLGALSDGSSAALADHARVVQILTNLISNAIKSTPEGGSILVSAFPGENDHPGCVVFAVEDTGCGIAREDQERIFQRFTQIVPAGQRREGVGLGLTIAKELVLLQKGSIWMESEIGRGSKFCFALPAAPSGRYPAPIEPSPEL